MKINIVMPKMGESVSEGTLIKWHKKEGDKVKKDEIIFEISTDKVDTEIPAPEDGIISEIKVEEQETVEVDTVVAVLETSGKGIEEVQTVNEEPDIPSTKQVGGKLIDVVMPKMGESVVEGTIIKWYKKEGDAVKTDEILFEISTDKVDTEVPSPTDGILKEIMVAEQETVEVGVVVARISSKSGIVDVREETPDETGENESKIIIKEKNKSEVRSNTFFSPLVMNIARKENIPFSELENIEGTGQEGRVTKKDVLNYIELKRSGKPKPETKIDESISIYLKENEEPEQETGDRGVEIVPMDNIRRKIMSHMVSSRDTSVHVTAMVEVDMSRIYNLIQAKKEEFQKKEGIKLTYMPFVAHSAIKALKEFPLLNSSIGEDNIQIKKFINLGIAVAVEPNGLIVPNIKNADEKSIRGLAKEIFELSIKSRSKKLLPDDVIEGTFTITNYGVFGTLFGTPIINQPEVGILGVGTVVKKPVVIELEGVDTIAIKPMMYLSLSHDHRLIDGMIGGKFLKAIKDSLENFNTKIV